MRDVARILSINSASFIRTFSNHANDIAGFDLCKKVELVAEYGSQDPVLHGWSPVDLRFDIVCKTSASFAFEEKKCPQFPDSFRRLAGFKNWVRNSIWRSFSFPRIRWLCLDGSVAIPNLMEYPEFLRRGSYSQRLQCICMTCRGPNV